MIASLRNRMTPPGQLTRPQWLPSLSTYSSTDSFGSIRKSSGLTKSHLREVWTRSNFKAADFRGIGFPHSLQHRLCRSHLGHGRRGDLERNYRKRSERHHDLPSIFDGKFVQFLLQNIHDGHSLKVEA